MKLSYIAEPGSRHQMQLAARRAGTGRDAGEGGESPRAPEAKARVRGQECRGPRSMPIAAAQSTRRAPRTPVAVTFPEHAQPGSCGQSCVSSDYVRLYPTSRRIKRCSTSPVPSYVLELLSKGLARASRMLSS